MIARSVACAVLAALCVAGAARAQPAVHSRAELTMLMASGPTALDALTPHGKQVFLDSLKWGERDLSGFSPTPLVRELTAAQIAGVLRLLDSASYADMLVRMLNDGAPLRFAAPSTTLEAAGKAFKQYYEDNEKRRWASVDAGTALGTDDLARYYHAAFAAYLQAQTLSSRQHADLLLLFDVASQVVLSSGDAQALGQMRAIYAEFGRRGIDTRRTLDDSMVRALLAGRRFGEARAVADAHPRRGREAIPGEIDSLGASFRGRSLYRFDAAANTLERHAVAPMYGTQVVLVVDAGCKFSEEALKAIGSDRALHERLGGAGLLVMTLPRTPVPTRFMADWNAKYPQLALRAPFNAEEWADVDVVGVPAFFILENGRVRKTISGWPGQEQKTVLLRALDGLSP
jgi:hypothetical protein